MGVHGLTSYVKSCSSLASTVHLTEDHEEGTVPLFVDALAFLYHTATYDSYTGGNYAAYARLVRRYIEYWRAVGLDPHFVFDGEATFHSHLVLKESPSDGPGVGLAGPFDREKLPTVIQRSQATLDKMVVFFRSSDAARADPLRQQAAARLPLLALSACTAELQLLGVEMHFADAEADSLTVKLAQQLNGFTTSNDSDYFIFSFRCRGYVPLSEIEYGASGSNYPPEHESTRSLRLRIYQPDALARLLSLPIGFLPIFAALVGNDRVNHFVELSGGQRDSPRLSHQMTSTQLERIARNLAKLGHLPASTAADREEIIKQAVKLLVGSKSTPNSNVLRSLAGAADFYVLSPLARPANPFPLLSDPRDTATEALNRRFYASAYRNGRLGFVILQFLKHGIFIPRGALEDPDLPSTAISLGQSIRLWMYAVVNCAVFTEHMMVVEYLRRGVKLSKIEVPVLELEVVVAKYQSLRHLRRPLSTILSAPLPERLAILSTAFSFPDYSRTLSTNTRVREPPIDPAYRFLPILFSLRHIQRMLKRPWTTHELMCAIFTAVLLDNPTSNERLLRDLGAPQRRTMMTPSLGPSKADLQRCAELTQTLFHFNALVEVLLLTDDVRASHELFEGRVLVAMLKMEEQELERKIQLQPELGRRQVTLLYERI